MAAATAGPVTAARVAGLWLVSLTQRTGTLTGQGYWYLTPSCDTGACSAKMERPTRSAAGQPVIVVTSTAAYNGTAYSGQDKSSASCVAAGGAVGDKATTTNTYTFQVSKAALTSSGWTATEIVGTFLIHSDTGDCRDALYDVKGAPQPQ